MMAHVVVPRFYGLSASHVEEKFHLRPNSMGTDLLLLEKRLDVSLTTLAHCWLELS